MSRPTGSTNKPKLSTWMGTSKDPVNVILEIMLNKSLDDDMRLRAAVSLMPFVHRKMPIALDVDVNHQPITAIELVVTEALDA